MPTKRVTDIIIGKDVSSGEGFVRVLNSQMAALVAGDTIADSDTIYIEQTLAGGTNKIYSLPIHGVNVRRWNGESATNATLEVVTIANINVISDQEYGLFISWLSDKDLSLGNRRYFANFITDTSATLAEIQAGIVAAVNATTFPVPVTASISGNNILITADNPTVNFSVGKSIGFDSGVTVTVSTTPDPGIGTYDQILALEDQAKGYKGYMGERRTFIGDLPGFSRPTYFSTGTALSTTSVYDIYVIDHDNPQVLQGPSLSAVKPATTYICIPKGPSTFSQANFEGILNPWFNSCPGQFANVNL